MLKFWLLRIFWFFLNCFFSFYCRLVIWCVLFLKVGWFCVWYKLVCLIWYCLMFVCWELMVMRFVNVWRLICEFMIFWLFFCWFCVKWVISWRDLSLGWLIILLNCISWKKCWFVCVFMLSCVIFSCDWKSGLVSEWYSYLRCRLICMNCRIVCRNWLVFCKLFVKKNG